MIMKHHLFFLPVWFLSLPLLLMMHLAIIVFLPYPFSEINILAAAIVTRLLITESGEVVWWAFGLFYLLDWYTVGPFGVVLSAGVLTTLLLVWLYRGILTNRGVWSAAILSSVFVALFRLLYTIGLFLSHRTAQLYNWPLLARSALLEMLTTTLFISLIYFALAQFLPALKVTHTKRTNVYTRN